MFNVKTHSVEAVKTGEILSVQYNYYDGIVCNPRCFGFGRFLF